MRADFCFAEKFFLFALIFAIFLLPSGTLGPVNLKISLLVVGGGLAFRYIKIGRRELIFLTLLVFAILLYFCIALVNNVPLYSSLSAASAILSAFLPPIVLCLIARRRENCFAFIVVIILAACATYGVIKIAFFIWALLGGPVQEVFDGWYYMFGYSPITYNYGWFFRINTPVDFVLVPALLLVLFFGGGGYLAGWKWPIVMILVGAVIISLSRYIYVYAALSFVFLFFSVVWRFSHLQFFFVLFVIVVMSVCGLFGYGYIYDFVSDRYFGDYAAMSDSVRDYIHPFLMSALVDHWFFGGGLGYFVEKTVVFDTAPWNSVLLWYSLLVQFGVLGVTLVLVLFSFPIVRFHLRSLQWWGLLGSYLLFVSSGFFNTFLLTSSVSLLYFIYFYCFYFGFKGGNNDESAGVLSSAISSDSRK